MVELHYPIPVCFYHVQPRYVVVAPMWLITCGLRSPSSAYPSHITPIAPITPKTRASKVKEREAPPVAPVDRTRTLLVIVI